MNSITSLILNIFLVPLVNPKINYFNGFGLVSVLGFNLLTFLFSFYFMVKLFKNWQVQKELRNLLFPALMAVTVLTFRSFMLTLNEFIKIYTNNGYEIKRVFIVVFLFALMFYFTIPIIKNVVRVPQRRVKRFNLILNTVKILSLLLFFTSPIFAITGNDNLATLLLILVVLPFTVPLTFLINKESKENASKIMKIRLEMLTMAMLGILGFITVAIIGLALDRTVYARGWPIYLFFSFWVLLNITLLISLLGFYWTYITPDWMRKKHKMFTISQVQNFSVH